jgi:hypothetical protein
MTTTLDGNDITVGEVAPVTPPPVPIPDRYRSLAAALRAAADECQAAADASPIEAVGRADRHRARVFRQAAAVAEHTHWAVGSP